MDAEALFNILRNDMKMKKFLPILDGHEKYPVFYAKNVFIEITGTDLMKCKICLAVLAAQFSEYCGGDSKFTIE